MLLGEQVKPEMIQSMIEVGTGICANIKEARTDITNLPVNTFNLILKRYFVHTLSRYSLLWTGAIEDLLSVTFVPHG